MYDSLSRSVQIKGKDRVIDLRLPSACASACTCRLVTPRGPVPCRRSMTARPTNSSPFFRQCSPSFTLAGFGFVPHAQPLHADIIHVIILYNNLVHVVVAVFTQNTFRPTRFLADTANAQAFRIAHSRK